MGIEHDERLTDALDALRNGFGIEALTAHRFHAGAGALTLDVRAAQERYVLKCPSISEMNSPEREPELCAFLHSRGLSVSAFMPTLNGGFLYRHKGRIYHLQKFVEGTSYPLHGAPAWLMPVMSKTLGQIHIVLKTYPTLPDGIGEAFFKHMTPENALHSYERSLDAALRRGDMQIAEEIRERIAIVENMPRRRITLSQLTRVNTHGDYTICQLICGEGRINAVIDWTSACRHPAVWELFRSFIYAEPSCAGGETDATRLCGCVAAYLTEAPLSPYDIEMMPYLYFYQLAVCDYYAQYDASDAHNRDIYLHQARFGTAVMRDLNKQLDALTEALVKRFC